MEPLTIENFDVSDSFISEPYLSTYGLTSAKFVSLETSKSLPPIRIDGEFKVFINKNGKNKSFLLALSVDESNEEFFKRLEHSLSKLASVASPLTKPEDFKLIKESKNYRNVYSKIYNTYPSGTPKCLYSELVSGKRRSKPLEDAAFEKFKGSYVVRIIHAFSGKTKGITVCADEVINYDSKKSCYNRLTRCVTESVLVSFHIFLNIYSAIYNVLKISQKS